ncbi:MAG: hypothetical protein M3238_06375, partial [Actinomycetota bacterium]|nr:hypothetical protein [Actinomycetota bacterium]
PEPTDDPTEDPTPQPTDDPTPDPTPEPTEDATVDPVPAPAPHDGVSSGAALPAPRDQAAPVARGGATTTWLSPNGDGRMDAASLAVDFTETTAWTLTLLDGDVELLSRRGVGDTVRLTWDGTVEGRVVPDGTYVWRVTGSDAAGNALQPLTGQFTIDTTAPWISRLRVEPNVRLRRLRGARITFTVRESAHVELYLRRRGRAIELVEMNCSAGAPVAIHWDGRNAAGKAVRSGRYRLRVVAVDSASNATVLDTKPIVVAR